MYMMIRVVTRVINENKGTQRMCINLMTSAKTFNEYFWIISHLKLNRTVIIYIHIAIYLSIAYKCQMTDNLQYICCSECNVIALFKKLTIKLKSKKYYTVETIPKLYAPST